MRIHVTKKTCVCAKLRYVCVCVCECVYIHTNDLPKQSIGAKLVYTCMCVCAFVHVCVYVCVCVYICVCVCVHTNTIQSIFTRKCALAKATYTHTYIHAPTCFLRMYNKHSVVYTHEYACTDMHHTHMHMHNTQ